MASRLIDTAILVDLLRGNALTQSWLFGLLDRSYCFTE